MWAIPLPSPEHFVMISFPTNYRERNGALALAYGFPPLLYLSYKEVSKSPWCSKGVPEKPWSLDGVEWGFFLSPRQWEWPQPGHWDYFCDRVNAFYIQVT